jgi:hypothetical protein
MTIDAFEASLSLPNPPQEWDAPLQALWWDARGDWNQAHALAQMDETDTRCAWVHAYLHRKEERSVQCFVLVSAGSPTTRERLPRC